MIRLYSRKKAYTPFPPQEKNTSPSIPPKAHQLPTFSRVMYLLALILSYCALATATSPPIIPVVQKAPTPQWGDMSPGLYRFVNVATRTALSVSDSGADSLVVSMYIAPFPSSPANPLSFVNARAGPSQTTTTHSAGTSWIRPTVLGSGS